MITRKQALSSLFAISMAACGGGGGGGVEGVTDTDETFFGGVYRVHEVAVENNCDYVVNPTDRILTVNQVGSKIVIDDNFGYHYEGSPTGESGFIASNAGIENCVLPNGTELPNITFQFTSSYRLDEITETSARVTFTNDSGNCSRGPKDDACSYKRVGTAVRSKQ